MEQGEDQAIFKSRVKQWLKSHQLDYKWMAEQCGVSEITVRNWMSQKPIPALKEQLLERVMVQLPSVTHTQPSPTEASVIGVEVQTSVSLSIKLSPDVFRSLETKAEHQGLSLNDLLAQAISNLIHENPRAQLPSRKVILPPKEG